MKNPVLWKPNTNQIKSSQMTMFTRSIENKFSQHFNSYNDFHTWSVNNLEDFWTEIFNFYPLVYEGSLNPACTDLGMESYGWFSHIKLNFAENLLANGKDEDTALVSLHESRPEVSISYGELKNSVANLQAYLQKYLHSGDVLAAYMPNIPETVIAMLAATGLGATFTSTSSDFGIEGVLDRFLQSAPKVLVAAMGYEYGGKYFDQMEKIQSIVSSLPSLQSVILVDFLKKSGASTISKSVMWQDVLLQGKQQNVPIFMRNNFNHPLYIMYSSGTTGKPKCIVHSAGGTLLQHVKELGLHSNLDSSKNIFYFTTCGWMMWNWLVSSTFFGSTIVLYEGSPGYPSIDKFMATIDQAKPNIFGTSPKFLKALENSGYDNNLPLASVETLLSTGAPLLPEQFDFIYSKLKKDLRVSSICGGTDIIGCFMLGNPNLPVLRGEIQCLGLGMDVTAFDDDGKEVLGSEGELVCKQSFPSRPLYFLHDEDQSKMRSAYFEKFPGVWHHGDFITITREKGVQVFGRSDATLNPGGVRIGTSEIYRQTEQISSIVDSLCVGRPNDGDVDVILFVKLKDGVTLDTQLSDKIKTQIRKNTTPRHVPQSICAVDDIPYTRSGKKMELAVARILAGKDINNLEAMANPECLAQYKEYRR